MAQREAKEVSEVKEAKENGRNIAAFFDLDGTMVPWPSLEKRFFSRLRYKGLIGVRNYCLWVLEALRLVPRGIGQMLHANKMYLRGVRADKEGFGANNPARLCVGGEDGKNGRRRQARMPVPLFPEAIERLAWHAERGHWIVIVSGTLEPLAERAARVLEDALEARWLRREIRVCATRLEAKEERWTGRIVGEAMFGEVKALAIKRVAAEMDLDLERCFAYGNSSSDRWMLEAVGRPAAVNPSNDLARIARRNDWTVLRWRGERSFTQRTQRAQRSQRKEETRQRLQTEHLKSGYRT